MSKPKIEIHYCPKCRWLLRSAWLAQELLTTFEDEVGELSLIPSEQSGVFQVFAKGRLVWCRKLAGRFPEAKELKTLVRDEIAPGKALGHSECQLPTKVSDPAVSDPTCP